MRRSIALLVGVAVAAPPVAAAPVAPGTATSTISTPAGAAPSGTGVPSDAIGLVLAQVAGSGLAVTLDPGGSEEHDLVVSNHTANLRLTIKLTATDATGNLGTAAASWLSFGDDTVQLDPHAATTVPMSIAVPHDTQPASALAHVTATVESAVAAADGSPVAGTATQTFPVSISVRGTPTAQIAIADVHRDDQGSRHLLAIVLRNFGAQGAHVSGHARVAGDHPQTLPFVSDLVASRDTTIELPWSAPPVGTPSDIAVDLEYGGGNVASWSSRLGGAPTDLSAGSGAPVSTATTAPVTSVTAPAPTTSGSVSATKPWWKQPFVTVLVILALLGAGLWFGFEMRASSRRRGAAGFYGMPPGWAPVSSDVSADLAKQLVRLTEVIVELTTTRPPEREIADDRPRARSPDPAPAGARAGPLPFRPFEGDELRFARAGPAPPGPAAVPIVPQPEAVRSAQLAPGDLARPAPDVVARPAPDVVARPAPAPENREVERAARAARLAMMQRLTELDEQRRHLRAWMDAEESSMPIEPPLDQEPAG